MSRHTKALVRVLVIAFAPSFVAAFTARAGAQDVVPASMRVSPPLVEGDLRAGGACAQYTDVPFFADPTNLANLTALGRYLDAPSPLTTNRADLGVGSLDVEDHNNGCVARGDFRGGHQWPLEGGGSIGAVGVVRVDAFINAPSRDYTFGLAANDAARLTIGGVVVAEGDWSSGDWKHFRWVTFEAPGVYPIRLEASVDHFCTFDAIEVMVAPGHVDGFDDVSCATSGSTGFACADGLDPSGDFRVLAAPMLLPTADGALPNSLDSDGDGIPDGDEGCLDCGGAVDLDFSRDTDRDGTPDCRDVDSDDDGFSDAAEAGDVDPATPLMDFDRDGVPDAYEYGGCLDGGCIIDGRCYREGDASPATPCLVCDPWRDRFAFAAAPTGVRCDDEVYCTVDDACDGAGRCGGAPRDCDDGIVCTTDVCDEAARTCSSQLAPAYCMVRDRCIAEGERNGDDCRACVSASSTSELTYAPSDTCDTDFDTVPDVLERPGGVSIDTDIDGTPDERDFDDDGDGIDTVREAADDATDGDDADRDGEPSYRDRDADDDGTPDEVEGRGDANANGIPAYLDPLEPAGDDGGVPLPRDGGISDAAVPDATVGDAGAQRDGGATPTDASLRRDGGENLMRADGELVSGALHCAVRPGLVAARPGREAGHAGGDAPRSLAVSFGVTALALIRRRRR